VSTGRGIAEHDARTDWLPVWVAPCLMTGPGSRCT
jgi:hypothetical protein